MFSQGDALSLIRLSDGEYLPFWDKLIWAFYGLRMTCSGGPTAQIHGNAAEIAVQIHGKMPLFTVVKLQSRKCSRV